MSKSKPFFCTVCNKTFRTESGLRWHLQNIHRAQFEIERSSVLKDQVITRTDTITASKWADKLTLSQAKQSFRYLKRGVIPPERIEYFTYGRENDLSLIDDALAEVENGKSRHFFLEANYGYGKSHMLKAIESLALRNNFAVARIIVDGYVHAFNHPPRYIHSLFENLRVPILPFSGLSELVTYWLKSTEKDSLLRWANTSAPWKMRAAIYALADEESGMPFPSYYQTYSRRVIECRDIQHRGSTYFPLLYDNLRVLLDICRAVGLRGLVLLFDEVESIVTLLPNILSRLRSYQILDDLANSHRFPYCCFFFAITPDFETGIRDENWKYRYYEAYYSKGCEFTKKWQNSGYNIMRLGRIPKVENIRFCMDLRGLHEFAYSWSASDQIPNSFIKAFVEEAEKYSLFERDIIKSFVDILEICQQNPACRPDLDLSLF